MNYRRYEKLTPKCIHGIVADDDASCEKCTLLYKLHKKYKVPKKEIFKLYE